MTVDPQKQKKRVSIAGVLFRLIFAALIWGGLWVAIKADQVIPLGWNPLAPLEVADPVTPFTQWRLSRALASPETCLAALGTSANMSVLEDLEVSDVCHIRNRVEISGVGQSRLKSIETNCAIGLRLAMWERHSLQPVAKDVLGQILTGIEHLGSYNCRAIRTSSARNQGMSTHATADAIDISGFRFSDGTEVELIDDWDADSSKAQFLRKARDGACRWFNLTLSPDYNVLHDDHFHLQSRGWGSCR